MQTGRGATEIPTMDLGRAPADVGVVLGQSGPAEDQGEMGASSTRKLRVSVWLPEMVRVRGTVRWAIGARGRPSMAIAWRWGQTGSKGTPTWRANPKSRKELAAAESR